MIVYNLIEQAGSVSTKTHDGAKTNGHGASVKTYNVIHPETQAIVHQVQRSTEKDLLNAITASDGARSDWATTPLQKRCEIITAAADLIEDHSTGWFDRLRQANLDETSVPSWWSRQQLIDVVGFLRGLVSVTSMALASEKVSHGPCEPGLFLLASIFPYHLLEVTG